MFDTCFSRLWGALTVLFIALVAHQSVSAQEARPKTTLTIAHPIALKGNAIAPYDPMPNMTTVFCSVIVDNQTGNPLTMTQVQPGNIDNSTVFDTLMLVTCDNQGKTLDRALYMWNPFSFPRQIALPQGKTTNTLFYHLPFAALSTNKELTIRLEGHLGSMWRGSGPLTSNIVKLTLK